jgi:hypothetical protein
MSITLISTQTLATTTASITFSSIPSSYTDLYAVFSLKSNFASSDYDDLGITVNGVSTNMSFRQLYGYGASAGSNTGTGSFGRAFIAGNSSTANSFGNGTMLIPNYAGSTNKSISVDSVMDNNNTNTFIALCAGLWANTAAITSVNFQSTNGGNLLSGSMISLYGVTKGSSGGVTVS